MVCANISYFVQLWEVYKDRRCIRTYYGHRQAVRDISFDNDGKRFLSAAYDRYVKLWDTETGACISRFTNRNIPYCAKFNPDPDKQHLFVAGTSDKKIICVRIAHKEYAQIYSNLLQLNSILHGSTISKIDFFFIYVLFTFFIKI